MSNSLISSSVCIPDRKKREAEHVKLCYLVKSSAELQPSVWKGDGGSEEVLLSTNRLVPLHCSLQSVQSELRRAGPVSRQEAAG